MDPSVGHATKSTVLDCFSELGLDGSGEGRNNMCHDVRLESGGALKGIVELVRDVDENSRFAAADRVD